MMKMLLAICALAAACSPEIDRTNRGAVSSDLVTTNGENLNGENLNGENLNGENLNGTSFNGPGMAVDVQYGLFAGASIGNRTLDSAWLEGTVFHGIDNGREFSGMDFESSRFQGVMLDGTPVSLRIVDIDRASFPNNDVWSYLVQFRDSRGIWHPLCLDANNDAVYATGTTDAECRAAAITSTTRVPSPSPARGWGRSRNAPSPSGTSLGRP
jgi:uncharacterized protein YjbI with pentapeptide repeats